MLQAKQILLLVAVSCASIPFTDGTCREGKTDDYAFCCCKKIYVAIATPTISIIPSTVIDSSTVVPFNASVVANISPVPSSSYSPSTAIFSSRATANISATPNMTPNVSPSPSPTPIYRNDGCFYTEAKYGYYNECYCNYTRHVYAGFNDSNGYYTTDPNATDFDYKCWNLPKPRLYIGGLIDTATKLGKKMIVAADMALEEINENVRLLPGYELVLLRQNSTKHLISDGSGLLLDYLNQNPKKVALLGPDDNDLAKTVAAIASLPRYKLLQISYGTNAIELSLDHSTFYSYFFRTKPFLDLLYNKARIAMLEKYSWGNVGLLYSNDVYYSQLNANLRTQLQGKKISISIEEEFVTDPFGSLEHFQRKDVHVILGSFSGTDASRVWCAAYKLKMYGPRYVYLFVGYTYLQGIDGCTLEQVKCAARYQFLFGNKVEACTHHFYSNYTARLNETYFNTSNAVANAEEYDYGKYIYDAIYVIANVLHSVDNDKGNSSRFYLSYAYGSDLYGGELRKKVLEYEQCGASGKVSFDQEGNRHYPVNVVQLRFGGGDLIVGDFDNNRSSEKLRLPFVRWPGNNIPYEDVKQFINWRYISKGLYIAYCIFAGLGILFALFCLFVLIWRRKHKEIRYSFYPLNIIIIIGCILVYISVFLFGVDNIISPVLTVDRVCRARLWVFSIGFVLAVGGMIAKLWIVQDVLSRRILMEKKRRRAIMFGIVGVIFLVTLIILICWHSINPLKRVIQYIRDEVNYPCDTDIWPDNPFTLKITAVEQCECANEIIWYFVIIIWKALLIMIAVYWAYQTREVFIPTINDTQRCGLCSYVIAACSVFGLIIALCTRLLPDVFFGLVGIIIIGCVTAVLIILFLHKILLVFACTRDRIVVKSATEEEDDINCFSRCLSKCRCGGDTCGCCTTCCKGNCPKCYLCLAACCAPLLLCCAPLLLCCSKLFACCGSSCRNCCCGSKSQRHGKDKAGEQKFIVKGIGDDKSAELARLQRELDMKNKYIQQMRRTELPTVHPIWTQTTEPVVLLSDTYDDDSDNDDIGDGKSDGTGANRGRKKRKRFRVLNRKLDFSNVKSKTDSNYKDGKVLPMDKLSGSKIKNAPGDNDGKQGKDEDNCNNRLPAVYIDSGCPENHGAEIAKLKKQLAERDAEIERLKNMKDKNKKNEFEMQEIDESVENDMKLGLGFPAKDQTPHTVVIIKPDDEKPKPKDEKDNCKEKGSGDADEELDDLIKELDTGDTPRGSNYDRNRNKFKVFGQKLDWSQIPSKLRAAGMIHHNGLAASNGDKDLSPGRTNKVSPDQKSTAGSSSSLLDPQSNSSRYNNNRRMSNIKIFHEKIDYSKIRSKIKPLISNDISRSSLSSSDTGSVRILNGPSEYNKKARVTPTTSSISLNKPDAPRSESNRSLNEPFIQTELKVKQAPDVESSPVSMSKPDVDRHNDSKPIETSKNDVKIVNDPKDYSHVRSKLIPDPPPKPNPDISVEPKVTEKPKSDVKILNDPKDYSHVRSKLIPDPPPKPNSDISIEPKVAEKPKSDVKILNDPKNYSHVKSKLIPEPPSKPDRSADISPREKPKILNAPQDYSHVKSKMPTIGSEPKKSTFKIQNKPTDYSHIKSKLV